MRIYILAAIPNSIWLLYAIVPLLSSYEVRDFSEVQLAVYCKFIIFWMSLVLSAWGGYRLLNRWEEENAIAKVGKSLVVFSGVAILFQNAVLWLLLLTMAFVHWKTVFSIVLGWLFVFAILVLLGKFDGWFPIGSGIVAAILLLLGFGLVSFYASPNTVITQIASPDGERAVYLERRYTNYYWGATCQFQIYTYHLGILQRSLVPDRPPWKNNRCWDYSRVTVQWSNDEDSIRWQAIGDRKDIPPQAGVIQLNSNDSTD